MTMPWKHEMFTLLLVDMHTVMLAPCMGSWQCMYWSISYVLHKCLLYVRVTEKDTMNFYIAMIIPVQLHKIT